MELRVDPNGQVMQIETLPNGAIIETCYDMEHHVAITTDKSLIVADNIDTATITATVMDYLGQPYAYSGPITWTVEDDQFELEATDGVCTMEVTSDFENVIDVTAWIPNSRGGKVIVYAKENPA